jgi:hypothetical protein
VIIDGQQGATAKAAGMIGKRLLEILDNGEGNE